MPWKVISPRSCRESAEALQATLNLEYSINQDRIINWGNSRLVSNDPVKVFGNKLESVARSTNKRVMFDLLSDLGCVPVITQENKDNFQHGCFIHVDPHGHNGSGILYKEEVEYNEGILATAEIKGDEYRCYFAYGTTFNIYKKVKLSNEPSSSRVHNSHNGWGYRSNPTELRTIKGLEKIIREYTVKAANFLELQYGAVDFIVDEGNLVYILETNSAPTLIEHRLVDAFASSINANIYSYNGE